MTRTRALLLAAVVVAVVAAVAGFQAAKPTSADPIIAGFRKTPVASVSDAIDQITGKRGFLSHTIRPVSPGKIVGPALTALVRPAAPDKATPKLAVKHSTEMIDNSKPGDVGVIVMENGLDVAAIGGLMGTAAKSRGMAGMILDGGVRDTVELRAMALPVYAASITPATAVSRWASVANNVPVPCGGITINPGDIIVADEDGIVAVPKDRAAEILKRAQEIDERESKMVQLIKQYKSLTKVVQMFNRI
jgi:4-hydroxy-4-methyl-2-oxoglutarate aldolase